MYNHLKNTIFYVKLCQNTQKSPISYQKTPQNTHFRPQNPPFPIKNSSFVEIYLERIRDLFDREKDNLKIKEDKGKTWIQVRFNMGFNRKNGGFNRKNGIFDGKNGAFLMILIGKWVFFEGF
jgi:hypothetical protein